jgi:hypothetical protein
MFSSRTHRPPAITMNPRGLSISSSLTSAVTTSASLDSSEHLYGTCTDFLTFAQRKLRTRAGEFRSCRLRVSSPVVRRAAAGS